MPRFSHVTGVTVWTGSKHTESYIWDFLSTLGRELMNGAALALDRNRNRDNASHDRLSSHDRCAPNVIGQSHTSADEDIQ